MATLMQPMPPVPAQINADATFLDRRFAAPGATTLLNIGEQKPADVLARGCEFDGTGVGRVLPALIKVGPGSRLWLIGSRLDNAPRLHITSIGEMLTVERCSIGAISCDGRPDDHAEAIFVHSGLARIADTVIDITASAGKPGGVTGLLFFQSNIGKPISADVDQTTLIGAREAGAAYAIQASSKGPLVVLRIANSDVRRGLHGYIGCTEENGGKVIVIDGGGNHDNGKPINLARGDGGAQVEVARLAAKIEAARELLA